jgi:positive phototaxis protein PixI
MSLITSPEQQTHQYLRFQLANGVQGMLPTHQLTEISSLTLGQVVPIPDISPAVMGVCNWRGEVLWLLDLGCWLGFEPLHAESFEKGRLNIMIVHHQGQTLGLGVKSVDQMIGCNTQQILPAPHIQGTPALLQCLQGYWSAPTGEVVLTLDGTSIIEGLR